MKRTLIILALLFAGMASLQAQRAYRIKQELPSNIDSISICSGWIVHLKQSNQASLTIVTPCQAFYDEANEPEVCSVDSRHLTLLENNSLPKSTIIEISITKPLMNLYVGAHSDLTTGRLLFAQKNLGVEIVDSAKVKGISWHTDGDMVLSVGYGASLKLDSLTADSHLVIDQWGTANLECPIVLSNDTKIKRSKRASGTEYQTDSVLHMTVKNRHPGYFHNVHQLLLNCGVTAPIPLYMNNTSGSPYNRGENYRISLQLGFNTLYINDRLSFIPQLRYEWDWNRLLNSVNISGNSLVLDNTVGAERPQQHLLGQYIGLDFRFNYAIGNKNKKTGEWPLSLDLGLSAMYNISGRLATRTMGTDDHWHRTNEKVDVFNPWQLRLHAGFGGGPLTRARIGVIYDLLPTFRSGIGADKVHTFGVTISF